MNPLPFLHSVVVVVVCCCPCCYLIKTLHHHHHNPDFELKTLELHKSTPYMGLRGVSYPTKSFILRTSYRVALQNETGKTRLATLSA